MAFASFGHGSSPQPGKVRLQALHDAPSDMPDCCRYQAGSKAAPLLCSHSGVGSHSLARCCLLINTRTNRPPLRWRASCAHLHTAAQFAALNPLDTPTNPPTSPLCQATAEMESKQFIKLCRDARLIDRRLTQTSCDLAFTKVKTMVSCCPLSLISWSLSAIQAAVDALQAVA